MEETQKDILEELSEIEEERGELREVKEVTLNKLTQFQQKISSIDEFMKSVRRNQKNFRAQNEESDTSKIFIIKMHSKINTVTDMIHINEAPISGHQNTYRNSQDSSISILIPSGDHTSNVQT